MEKLTKNQTAECGAGTVKASRKFNLKFGYQDKEDETLVHREIVISRRPNGADFIKSAEECSDSDLQFSLALVQSAISKFGSMQMPCPMTVLLSLNQIDREKLLGEYFSFLVETGAAGEVFGEGKVRLGKGFERGSDRITILEFGKILDGYAEIEIERSAKTFWQKEILRMSKEIVAPNDITVAEIESLDVDDFTLLRSAEEEWLNSFRVELEPEQD